MALVSINEAKQYLRVDSSDEDAMIRTLIAAAESLTKDVGRLSEEQWQEVIAAPAEADPADLVALRSVLKVSTMFALAYLFEHREEADHHDLTISMRNLLFSVREGVL